MASFTRVYWRNKSTSAGAQLLLIIASVAALLCIQVFKRRESTAEYEDMLAASQSCLEGLELIGRWRREIRTIDPEVDPLATGLIGIPASPVTTVSGHLVSKQATVNPNWAAVIVMLLRKAGVRRDDVLADVVQLRLGLRLRVGEQQDVEGARLLAPLQGEVDGVRERAGRIDAGVAQPRRRPGGLVHVVEARQHVLVDGGRPAARLGHEDDGLVPDLE